MQPIVFPGYQFNVVMHLGAASHEGWRELVIEVCFRQPEICSPIRGVRTWLNRFDAERLAAYLEAGIQNELVFEKGGDVGTYVPQELGFELTFRNVSLVDPSEAEEFDPRAAEEDDAELEIMVVVSETHGVRTSAGARGRFVLPRIVEFVEALKVIART